MEAFFELIKDVWDFFKNKKEILACSLIITIVLMGSLIIFTQDLLLHPLYIPFSKKLILLFIALLAIPFATAKNSLILRYSLIN